MAEAQGSVSATLVTVAGLRKSLIQPLSGSTCLIRTRRLDLGSAGLIKLVQKIRLALVGMDEVRPGQLRLRVRTFNGLDTKDAAVGEKEVSLRGPASTTLALVHFVGSTTLTVQSTGAFIEGDLLLHHLAPLFPGQTARHRVVSILSPTQLVIAPGLTVLGFFGDLLSSPGTDLSIPIRPPGGKYVEIEIEDLAISHLWKLSEIEILGEPGGRRP